MKEDRERAKALASTYKPTGKDNEADDDESGSLNFDPPGLGAEFSGEQQTKEKKPKIDKRLPSNLRDLVVGVANKPDCKGILDKMFNELKKFHDLLPAVEGKTFIETLFDSIGKYKIDPKNAGTGGTATGLRKAIRYGERNTPNPFQKENYYIQITIAEFLHHAGKKRTFKDPEIDVAGLNILKVIDPEKATSETERREDEGDDYSVGSIGHRLVNTYCQKSQEEINKGAK